jgi:hypothetical protein
MQPRSQKQFAKLVPALLAGPNAISETFETTATPVSLPVIPAFHANGARKSRIISPPAAATKRRF